MAGMTISQAQIEYGNTLICNFMGWEKGRYENSFLVPDFYPFIVSAQNTSSDFNAREMLFQTDWNWLMPVWRKLMDTDRAKHFETIWNKFHVAIDFNEPQTCWRAIVEYLEKNKS